MVIVGRKKLGAGDRQFVGVCYRDDVAAGAGGDGKGQWTNVAWLLVTESMILVGVAAIDRAIIDGDAIGLMGGDRHCHCQYNL